MIKALQPWLVGCLFAAVLSPRAYADPSSSKTTAAEIFFQEGVALLEAGALAEACAKFEASQRLDPALGTMLRLGDCYDSAGRTASAWAMFQRAAALARERNDAERQKLAEDRRAETASRQSKLKLQLDDRGLAEDTIIHVNGVTLTASAWNEAFPVDPGPQRIEVSAPRRLPWSTVAEVPVGPVTRLVSVPNLALAPDVQADLGPHGHADAGFPGRLRKRPLRLLGYALGGVGIAGVAVGAFLTHRAKDLNEKSLGQCRPDDTTACTARGVEQRQNAKLSAHGATAAFVAGGTILAGGVLLAILSLGRDKAPRSQRGLRVSGSATAQAGGVHLEGRW
jgi:hypothetical protein